VITLFSSREQSALPGFRLTLGYSVLYLSLIVLIPLSAVFLKTATMTGPAFLHAITSPRVLASYRLTFGASLLAALINTFFGLLIAWVLVRYRFPFKKIVDASVDLPFALPTAVAGIALAAIYAPNGWIGRWFEVWNGSAFCKTLGAGSGVLLGKLASLPGGHFLTQWLPSDFTIKAAYSPLGVLIALTFIGLPFVVRTVQPVLEDLEQELEEAAGSLGASRWQTFRRVLLPPLYPSLLTGFALSFARALGEYGSVVFISGNMPMHTEITPLLIITKLEQYDYAGATAIAVVMLVASFALLLIINLLQKWSLQKIRG
jgi:sulfate transport system permease protein